MKVCIDYGHRNNAFDFGATGNGYKESALALAIGEKVRLELERHEITCIRTRESEEDMIHVWERAEYANTNKADYFISIHINSFSNYTANGIETLMYEFKDTSSKAHKEAQELAENVQEQLILATGAKNRGIKYRNDLSVLSQTEMTAILIECGFISNKEEADRMATESYQQTLATAIAKGFLKTIDRDYRELVMVIPSFGVGSEVADTKDKIEIQIDGVVYLITGKIIDGRTYIVLRDFSQAGYKIDYKSINGKMMATIDKQC